MCAGKNGNLRWMVIDFRYCGASANSLGVLKLLERTTIWSISVRNGHNARSNRIKESSFSCGPTMSGALS
ncbi:unnamed protein product [Calypogeia fissa]